MNIPETIFNQLGGGRFVAFTGCKDFVGDKNSLRMSLPRNGSKANRLTITYNPGLDTYSMRFWRYTSFRFDHKRGIIHPEKFTDLKVVEDVYCDQLQEIFTDFTNLYTHF